MAVAVDEEPKGNGDTERITKPRVCRRRVAVDEEPKGNGDYRHLILLRHHYEVSQWMKSRKAMATAMSLPFIDAWSASRSG